MTELIAGLVIACAFIVGFVFIQKRKKEAKRQAEVAKARAERNARSDASLARLFNQICFTPQFNGAPSGGGGTSAHSQRGNKAPEKAPEIVGPIRM